MSAPPLDTATLRATAAAARERAEAAFKEIVALCAGPERDGRRFTMSIPVRSSDSDEILMGPVDDVPALAAAVEQLCARAEALTAAWATLTQHSSPCLSATDGWYCAVREQDIAAVDAILGGEDE